MHAYLAYDPLEFPSPTQPRGGDAADAMLDHMLAYGSRRKFTDRELADAIRPHIDIHRVAALGMVDDVIDPRDTRPLLARALALTANKQVERPFRRREIAPV